MGENRLKYRVSRIRRDALRVKKIPAYQNCLYGAFACTPDHIHECFQEVCSSLPGLCRVQNGGHSGIEMQIRAMYDLQYFTSSVIFCGETPFVRPFVPDSLSGDQDDDTDERDSDVSEGAAGYQLI